MKWKLAVCVAVAVVLQSSLRALWQPLAYANLPLIVVVYFLLHQLMGQPAGSPLGGSLAETAANTIIWTTVVGTLLAFALDPFFSDKARSRKQFAFRRRIARRGLGRRKY